MCWPLKINFVRTRHTMSNFLSDSQRHSFEQKSFSKLSVCFFPPGILVQLYKDIFNFRCFQNNSTISNQYHLKNFLVRQKYVCFEKKIFFIVENQKWQKKLNLKISQKGHTSGFGIFNFSNSNFFVIFGFPSKIFLFLKVNILLFYQNNFEDDSINREEDIL